MKQFVFFFRQSRQLSEAEQKQRTTEVIAWVQQQISEGRKLEPRILAEESRVIETRKESDPAPADKRDAVVALNFLEAHDFAEAVKIAQTHPGLRYGVNIEIRPWTSPLARTTP